MWKAIVSKELRENWWIAGLGLAAYLYAVAELTDVHLLPVVRTGRSWSMPFGNDMFLEPFAMISVGLTIALGLRQSISESVRGTWLFLLHRPLSRRGVVWLKLAVGAGLFLFSAVLPTLIYACWAATPGKHASPFFWSMTLSSWQTCFSLLAVYLAAFLSGLRPARWFGSRLFPLAGTGLIFFVRMGLSPWWFLQAGLMAALLAVLLASIFHVVRTRDYS
jgi:hypothetical protein